MDRTTGSKPSDRRSRAGLSSFLVRGRTRSVKRATPLGAAAALLFAGVALAAITTVANTPVGAGQVAASMTGSGANVVAADFTMNYLTAPANGVEDSPLNDFPTIGSTFGILTTGNVQLADDANSSASSGLDQNGGTTTDGTHLRGNTDFDATILRINLLVQAGANCLTFDFKFFSEEFPEYVNTQYNDAFIAELDASTWTTVGSTITAPTNFAFDPAGNVISINAAGNTSMTAGEAAGTTYDGATPLLSASTPVTPGAHNLYLSIFDQGDQIYDSAVFLDNLRIGFVPNPVVNCKPGAKPVNFQMTLTPAEATNPIGTPHTVTATLKDDNGNPVPAATIQFSVTGANPHNGVGVTDVNGEATHTYTGTNLGDDTITACYDADGDGAFEVCANAIKHWKVGAPATLDLTPKTAQNPVDTQHCVTATVKDIGGNPTPNIVVRFSVTGSVTTSGSATTDASGQAKFCYNGPPLPGVDAIYAYADTNSNNTQDPGEPSDTATKEWILPVSTPLCEVKITNGGWIIADNGDKSSFGGVAMADGAGNASGNEEYQDHGPAQAFNLHGNVLVVVCDSTTSATIYGKATIDGTGDHFYRIRVEDNKEPGKGFDKYWMLIDTGYDSGNKVLKGGNVQIHLG